MFTRHVTCTKLLHPLVSLLRHSLMLAFGPPLQRKQKSSLVLGLQIWQLKLTLARHDEGTQREWNVLRGAQIPVHIKIGPPSFVIFWPHFEHKSRTLSEASSTSAAIVAPS